MSDERKSGTDDELSTSAERRRLDSLDGVQKVDAVSAPRKLLYISIALGVAVLGFVSGTREAAKEVGYANPGEPSLDLAIQAPAYSDLRTLRWGPNAGMYPQQVAALALTPPDPDAPIPPPTASERKETLTVRATRRAYGGAPPVIPHAIDQTGLPGCLACHQYGVMAAGKVAPAMSHPPLANCTQCHVPATPPEPLRERMMADNSFVGVHPAGGGTRAWIGAPPTMPHPGFMRENCGSCHGIAAHPGLRTPHLERASCQQCHAPSAWLDRMSVPPHGGEDQETL